MFVNIFDATYLGKVFIHQNSDRCLIQTPALVLVVIHANHSFDT